MIHDLYQCSSLATTQTFLICIIAPFSFHNTNFKLQKSDTPYSNVFLCCLGRLKSLAEEAGKKLWSYLVHSTPHVATHLRL